MASPMGLATLDLMKWQVPWDLPLLNSQSGKSHGTCHFRSFEVASPVGLATFEIQKWPDTWDLPYHMLFDIFKMRNGKSPSSWVWFLEVASPKGLAIFWVKKWQVPWQVPFLNYPPEAFYPSWALVLVSFFFPDGLESLPRSVQGWTQQTPCDIRVWPLLKKNRWST